MIPVRDVIFFEASEKYVNVVTATGEALIRMGLREMTSRIDATDVIVRRTPFLRRAGELASI